MSFSSKNSFDQRFAGAVFTSGHPSARLAELRILVMEDEIFVSMALEEALNSAGAEVIGPFMSLAAGIEAIDGGAEIDGAILDVNLGDSLVFPLAEVLRDRGIPIIFHTALGFRSEFGEDFPDAMVCVKPTLPQDLVGHSAAKFS